MAVPDYELAAERARPHPARHLLEATARIHAELPDIEILGLSMHARSEAGQAFEQAGAADFFVKGTDTQRLIDHLLRVHAALVRTLDAELDEAHALPLTHYDVLIYLRAAPGRRWPCRRRRRPAPSTRAAAPPATAR